MNSLNANVYLMNSYQDVVTYFGDHSYYGQLAKAWYEAHIRYLRQKKKGMAAQVRQLKKTCLDAVAHAGNTSTFVVDGAMKRSLRGEIFPPGCGPWDTPMKAAA